MYRIDIFEIYTQEMIVHGNIFARNITYMKILTKIWLYMNENDNDTKQSILQFFSLFLEDLFFINLLFIKKLLILKNYIWKLKHR